MEHLTVLQKRNFSQTSVHDQEFLLLIDYKYPLLIVLFLEVYKIEKQWLAIIKQPLVWLRTLLFSLRINEVLVLNCVLLLNKEMFMYILNVSIYNNNNHYCYYYNNHSNIIKGVLDLFVCP